MNSNFITKVKSIIMDHIHDDEFCANSLASEIGHSRSYLYRKIKIATGKSVNQYIKKIRLQEAVKLIKSEEFTNSEIAYKVGFSSPSYFNKCFRANYGMTPGELKNRQFDELLPIELVVERKNKKQKNIIYLFSILLLILLLFKVNDFTNNKKIIQQAIKPHSIGVLPFDDFSKGNDTEWFCDGLTDYIISNLSKIKEYQVISRHSTHQYKDSNKNIHEIINELGVGYIVEGSVRKHNDSVLIIAQLIDVNGFLIWSNNYNLKFNDELGASSYIVQNIVEEINNELRREEEISLD